MLLNALLVFVGGGLGAVSRYLVTTFMGNHLGSSFPYGTFAANIIGSFCMGAVMFYFINKSLPVPEHLRLLLLVGFMGGFTTFSSFGYESLMLLTEGNIAAAAAYSGGSLLLGLLAAGTGVLAGKGV